MPRRTTKIVKEPRNYSHTNDHSQRPHIGLKNGVIAERTVCEAAREVERKDSAHLFVLRFAIAAKARQFAQDCQQAIRIPTTHQATPDVPAWFLDTNYNGFCFHVNQAFFPRTKAWDSLKKALKGTYDDEVWEHLAGTTSAPFEAGEHQEIAVKVIDDRGNELLVARNLKEIKQ